MNLEIGLKNLVNEYSGIHKSCQILNYFKILNIKLKQHDMKHKVYIKYGIKKYVILKMNRILNKS
jgi:hypothetical protein